MLKVHLYDKVLCPVVTEKSTTLSEQNKIVFKVPHKSNKMSLKKSIEKIFKVNVTKINIINKQSRDKITRGRKVKVKGYKKAIVTLKKGQTIDLTPMLDVVFIMLIFFIVTATFIKLPGPTVSKIDTVTEDPYKKVTILVAVTEVDEFWVDKKRLDENALKLSLTRMYNENPLSGMVIQADNESSIESVAKVADIARDIGISPVAISVEND